MHAIVCRRPVFCIKFSVGVVYATGGGLTPPCKVSRNDRTTHQEVAEPVSMRITPMFQLRECGAILHLS